VETLEEYVPHPIRNLDISNVNLPTFTSLWDAVRIKPAVVQNRFYPVTGYDVALRKFCAEKRIVYQSFWTLTANLGLLSSQLVRRLSEEVGNRETSGTVLPSACFREHGCFEWNNQHGKDEERFARARSS